MSPQSHKQHILQTPPDFLALRRTAYRALGRILILKFHKFDTLKALSLVNISGCFDFDLTPSCTLCFWNLFLKTFRIPTSVFQLEDLATLEFMGWIGGPLHENSSACSPVYSISNQITHLFSDSLFSQNMPDVDVIYTHPSICTAINVTGSAASGIFCSELSVSNA